MSIIQEFKEFALKGNMVDLAIGVIIGASFGKVVNSLVTDIMMPPLGFLIGGVDFSNLALTINPGITPSSEVKISYGLFLNSLIGFLIMVSAIFIVIKAMNVLRQTEKKPKVETKECTECCEAVNAKAKKCCHCGSQLK